MSTGENGKTLLLSWMDDIDDVSSVCDDVTQDQQDGRGSTSASYEWAGLYCTPCAQ